MYEISVLTHSLPLKRVVSDRSSMALIFSSFDVDRLSNLSSRSYLQLLGGNFNEWEEVSLLEVLRLRTLIRFNFGSEISADGPMSRLMTRSRPFGFELGLV